MDWLAHCQDIVTGCFIRSRCCQSSIPVGKHYWVAMRLHSHNWVPILMMFPGPLMVPGRKTQPTNTQPTEAQNLYVTFWYSWSFMHMEVIGYVNIYIPRRYEYSYRQWFSRTESYCYCLIESSLLEMTLCACICRSLDTLWLLLPIHLLVGVLYSGNN